MVEQKEQKRFVSLISGADGTLEQTGVCIQAWEKLEKSSQPADFLKWLAVETDQQWFSKKKADEQEPSLLSDLLSETGEVLDPNEEVHAGETEIVVHEDEMSSCVAHYLDLVRGLIGALTVLGLTEKEYYKELWDALCYLLKNCNQVEKGACLHMVFSDNRTPYYPIECGLRMTNQQYEETIEQIHPLLRKMLFVLNLKNVQKTETASQLLGLLDEATTKEEKTVFLSQMLEVYSRENASD